MDEKSIQEEQDQPAVKKVYIPPTLTKYGNLAELTAGGSGDSAEPNPQNPGQPPHKYP